MVCKIQECSMAYRQSETYSHKIPQKLTTTACFIQEESSDGRPHMYTHTLDPKALATFVIYLGAHR